MDPRYLDLEWLFDLDVFKGWPTLISIKGYRNPLRTRCCYQLSSLAVLCWFFHLDSFKTRTFTVQAIILYQSLKFMINVKVLYRNGIDSGNKKKKSYLFSWGSFTSMTILSLKCMEMTFPQTKLRPWLKDWFNHDPVHGEPDF